MDLDGQRMEDGEVHSVGDRAGVQLQSSAASGTGAQAQGKQ